MVRLLSGFSLLLLVVFGLLAWLAWRPDTAPEPLAPMAHRMHDWIDRSGILTPSSFRPSRPEPGGDTETTVAAPEPRVPAGSSEIVVRGSGAPGSDDVPRIDMGQRGLVARVDVGEDGGVSVIEDAPTPPDPAGAGVLDPSAVVSEPAGGGARSGPAIVEAAVSRQDRGLRGDSAGEAARESVAASDMEKVQPPVANADAERVQPPVASADAEKAQAPVANADAEKVQMPLAAADVERVQAPAEASDPGRREQLAGDPDVERVPQAGPSAGDGALVADATPRVEQGAAAPHSDDLSGRGAWVAITEAEPEAARTSPRETDAPESVATDGGSRSGNDPIVPATDSRAERNLASLEPMRTESTGRSESGDRSAGESQSTDVSAAAGGDEPTLALGTGGTPPSAVGDGAGSSQADAGSFARRALGSLQEAASRVAEVARQALGGEESVRAGGSDAPAQTLAGTAGAGSGPGAGLADDSGQAEVPVVIAAGRRPAVASVEVPAAGDDRPETVDPTRETVALAPAADTATVQTGDTGTTPTATAQPGDTGPTPTANAFAGSSPSEPSAPLVAEMNDAEPPRPLSEGPTEAEAAALARSATERLIAAATRATAAESRDTRVLGMIEDSRGGGMSTPESLNSQISSENRARLSMVLPPDAPDPVPARTPEGREQARAILDFLDGKVVEFQIGRDRLTENGQRALDELARLILKHDGTRIVVQGHTDSVGDHASNLELSGARALVARDYLVGAGVAANRLSVQGFGETRPIASNRSEEGRRRNRRIDFAVSDAR